MNSDTTKLLKHVDGDTYRRFRAHCIAEGYNMGPAISTLMQGVLSGKITLKASNDSIDATSRPGSWTWTYEREGGIP
jgi:hypothetical protein